MNGLRKLVAISCLLWVAILAVAGTWTPNNFLYEPSLGARGEVEKTRFDTGLERVDKRLGCEIWVGDPNYGSTPQTALTAIGGNQAVLRIPAGIWSIGANLTIPTNVTLKMERGAILTVATTKTLTIDGGLEAGLYQIFSCTGTGKVVLGNNSVAAALPEWWGAVGDDSTNDTAAIQAAVTAFKTVALASKTYKITSAITLTTNSVMYGTGPQSIIHQVTDGTVGINNANDTVIRDLCLKGPGGAYNINSIGINSYYYLSPPWTYPITESAWFGVRSVMRNLVVKNWGSNGVGIVSGGRVANCVFINCLNEAIIANGYDIIITDNHISGTYSWGIDVSGSRITVSNNILNNVGNKAALGSEDCGGIIANGALWITGANDIVVKGNIINTSTNTGIFIYAPPGTNYNMKSVLVEGNTVRNVNSAATGYPGAIAIQDATTDGGHLTNVIIANNIIDTTTVGYGIRAWGLTGGTIITGNKIHAAASNAIDIGPVGMHNSSNVSVSVNSISGLNNYGINLCGLTKFIVSNNIITGNTANGIGVVSTTTTGNGIITGNVIDTCLIGLYSDSTGDYIKFLDNDVSNGNSTSAYLTGTLTNCKIRGNAGFNPVGALTDQGGSMAVPASGVALQNNKGYDCLVTISDDMSEIWLGSTSDQMSLTGLTSGTFMVPAGSYIKLTYTYAPAWQWYGQ